MTEKRQMKPDRIDSMNLSGLWPGSMRVCRSAGKPMVVLWAVLLFCAASSAAEARADTKAFKIIDFAHPNLFLAPYVWKRLQSNSTVQVEATMPGAYLKAVVQGTAALGVIIDGSANNGCPASSMPVIEYSVDQGPFKIVQLTKTGDPYNLPLAASLDSINHHSLELYFRAADLEQKRWQASTGHLRLNGLALEQGGSLLPVPLRSKRALAYGDSITEGVGVDGLFTSWSIIDVNNARATWFPLVCAAMDCEYGQLGSGGWGMSNPKLEVPPLPLIWDHYDANTSRLVNGVLSPEPDYVFCALGTNDPGMDITADYIRWLTALREACRRASVFCVVPPLGWHKSEVRAAVSARNQAGDKRVYLIDLAPLEPGFRAGHGATTLAYDGVHPSVYGNALLGVVITAETQRKLSN